MEAWWWNLIIIIFVLLFAYTFVEFVVFFCVLKTSKQIHNKQQQA